MLFLNNIWVTTIIPIIIIVLTIIAFFYIIITYKKKEKLHTKKTVAPGSNIKLINEYCSTEEMLFLAALHNAMPLDLIAFPCVSLGKIVEPKGDKIQFNKVYTKYVDIVVFLRKNMQPVLVIDLISPNPIKQAMKALDDDIIETLKYVKLPLLQTKIKDRYVLEELKKDIINALPDKVVAMLIK